MSELSNHLSDLELDHCKDILVENGIELLQDVAQLTADDLEGLGLDAADAATLASSLNGGGGGGGGSGVGGEPEAERQAREQREYAAAYAKWEEQVRVGAAPAAQQETPPPAAAQETSPPPQETPPPPPQEAEQEQEEEEEEEKAEGDDDVQHCPSFAPRRSNRHAVAATAHKAAE
eukprot:scaffold89945_cov36-Phaeocystis_antarctica.AAC.1